MKNDSNQVLLEKYLTSALTKIKKSQTGDRSSYLLLRQNLELAQSISVLLKNDCVWQSEILKRSLGENTLIIFVICSLNDKAKKAYEALYELHGWHETLDIFGKLAFTKHKNGKYQKLLEDRVKKLESLVLAEFKSSEEEVVKPKELKIFVRNKLSKHIYRDAEIALQKYKDFPFIKTSIKKLLKSGGQYQVESNFVHSRFLSSVVASYTKDNKSFTDVIVKDTLNRLHLALSIYALNDDELSSFMDELTSIVSQIPNFLI